MDTGLLACSNKLRDNEDDGKFSPPNVRKINKIFEELDLL